MSAHEDDASACCANCGVTFDVHDQLGCKVVEAEAAMDSTARGISEYLEKQYAVVLSPPRPLPICDEHRLVDCRQCFYVPPAVANDEETEAICIRCGTDCKEHGVLPRTGTLPKRSAMLMPALERKEARER